MASAAKKEKLRVKFRSGTSIGAAAAEDDREFLQNCFVDSGYTYNLLDVENSRSIIVARTGAGKTALMNEAKGNCENHITIEPDQLAFTYIANSNILRFFDNLGVNLDLFYQLLWRHVFCIELIKMRYCVHSEEENKNVFSTLWNLVNRDTKKERALKYLEEWGNKFWLDTDIRIKEITQKIESKLKASADGLSLGIPLSLEYLSEMGTEIKKELLQRSQNVINDIQIKELHEVISILAEDVFVEASRKYFIFIDDLDKSWAVDPIRYKLIRALIETTKRLRKIRTVKIIAAIRTDLLDKVIAETIDAGFQHEKYEDSYLRIQWTENDLRSVLERRISYLFKSSYTKEDVAFADVFPFKYHSELTSDYFIARTQLRPRDLILFVNECLAGASGGSEITQTIIHEAEVRYSRGRLRSVVQEWANVFPALEEYAAILQSRRPRFTLGDIPVAELGDICLKIAASSSGSGNAVHASAVAIVDSGNLTGHKQFLAFLSELFTVLHRVGLVGVKVSAQDPIMWADRAGATPIKFALTTESRISVHPMYWIAFGISPINMHDFRS